MNMDDIEDFVVVGCPKLYNTVCKESRLLINKNSFEFYSAHSSVLNVSDFFSEWVICD